MGQLQRLTGACCALAGAAWVAACLVHNTLPQGCIGDACAGGPPLRGETPVDLSLFALAGLSLAAGLAGLLVIARRRRDRAGAAVVAGLVCAAGLALLLTAGVVATLVEDWAGMPGLVVPGLGLLVLGLVLVGVVLLRARVVPVPLSVAVLATAALLPFANEQTSRILLAVPFGLALLAVGAHLLRVPTAEGAARATARRPTSRRANPSPSS